MCLAASQVTRNTRLLIPADQVCSVNETAFREQVSAACFTITNFPNCGIKPLDLYYFICK